MENQIVMDKSSRVIRISSLNHHRIVSKGHYGDTFDSILSRILAYLYNKGEDGANSYTIQRKANIPSSQEYNRFKGFLDYLQNNSEKITYIGKRTMDND